MLQNDKAAVVVGIDEYSRRGMLYGCCADAQQMAKCLKIHENGHPNMDVTLMTSATSRQVTTRDINDALEELFASTLRCAVVYLAGHSITNKRTGETTFVTQDGDTQDAGVRLEDILGAANDAFPRIQSTVIILDTCSAGSIGESATNGARMNTSTLGEGVTVLAASGRRQAAGETVDGGVFTTLMVEALKGSAADLLGHVTPASVYAFIDQNFGAVGQRPVYKANVSRFISLRECAPRIDPEYLLSLPEWFPVAAKDPEMQDRHPLDPRYEPNRDNVPQAIMDIEPDPVLTAIFSGLQACNRQGLVVPDDAELMYYAAINSKLCRLTPLGRHYRNLVDRGSLIISHNSAGGRG